MGMVTMVIHNQSKAAPILPPFPPFLVDLMKEMVSKEFQKFYPNNANAL